ncbi:hypothetical protein predicted by Glimmer/Critica [Acetobacter ghanensis]|uniref:Uncharacterized protein n=1 Tax=Acetobacter ghanensis TaxID=431306 RepID=A0A0U4YCB4_9PROT|nr:hypothetical protein predicted by Glimmer/Critica [Acetobacter ghanensis]
MPGRMPGVILTHNTSQGCLRVYGLYMLRNGNHEQAGLTR